jgi:GAF domain-containing protein
VSERESLVARTFVEVADSLVDDYDVLDLLTVLASRCVELFDVEQAGLMLSSNGAPLRVAAASSEAMRLLELFELQHDEGPCVDCFRVGQSVSSSDLEHDRARWPVFAPEAINAGFRAALAIPMRFRDQTIGSLNLLRAEGGLLDEDDVVVAQAIADVATIGIVQHRIAAESRLLSEQLQHALDSRVVIEQAKGVLAAGAGLDMEAAFASLRAYARSHNERLAEVARDLVSRQLTVETIVGPTG